MVSVVSVVILLYCVGNGTKIFNIFNPEVSKRSEREYPRDLFISEILGRRSDGQLQWDSRTIERCDYWDSHDFSACANLWEWQCHHHHQQWIHVSIHTLPHDSFLDEWMTNRPLLTRKENEKSSGTPHERAFYQFILALVGPALSDNSLLIIYFNDRPLAMERWSWRTGARPTVLLR